MADKEPLDLVVDSLVVVGTFKRFTIAYAPHNDQWHAILPGAGSIFKPEKAAAAYTGESVSVVKEAVKRHWTHNFAAFHVVAPAPFMPPAQAQMFNVPIIPEVWNVTSYAGEGYYWMTNTFTKEKRKQTLSNFYIDTSDNRRIMSDMAVITKQVKELNERYHELRGKLVKAQEPLSDLDTLLTRT